MKRLLLLLALSTSISQIPAQPNDLTLSERVVELLVRRNKERQAEGSKLLVDNRRKIVGDLIIELDDSSPARVEAAAFELGILFSPWKQGTDSGSRFIEFTEINELRRPVERPNFIAEANVIRESLKKSFTRMRQQAEANPRGAFNFWEALKCVASALEEFADDQVIDWAMDELTKIKSPYHAESLFILVENYLGCTRSFRANLICGNSTAEEVDKFMQTQAEALAKALAQLQAKWAVSKALTEEQRIEAPIRDWRKEIIGNMRQSSGSYSHQGRLSEELAPLIRFGVAALPQLRKQRATEGDVGERAVWDFVIAAITGDTDKELIRALMNGSDPQRIMACEIIAASGQIQWAADLQNLKMVNGYHLGKASQTLAACLYSESIPLLEELHASYPKESETEYALLELKARLSKGEPRRRIGIRLQR